MLRTAWSPVVPCCLLTQTTRSSPACNSVHARAAPAQLLERRRAARKAAPGALAWWGRLLQKVITWMLNVCVKSHEGLRYSASKVVAGLGSSKVETTQVVELQGVHSEGPYTVTSAEPRTMREHSRPRVRDKYDRHRVDRVDSLSASSQPCASEQCCETRVYCE